MFTRFFIDRPIFASVISIVITLAGALALFNLPVAMFPQIAPPTVMVTCQYPGANAQVVADTVAAPIEQKVNGVDDMMYMSSQSTNDGNYTLTVTFKQGVDLNLAQVLVQNRVALALPMLPDVIKATGVTTRKRSPDILLSIGLLSPDGRYDQLYLSNYALMHVREELARLPGISDVGVLGTRNYSMRIWLDPDRLAARGLNAGDVVAALREQNAQVAAGSIGQSPGRGGSRTQFTIDTLGRLEDVEQFRDVIVRDDGEGRIVRVGDLGEVELGARSLDIESEINGQPVANMAIFMLPDSNALETADVVRAKIAELKRDFPEGLDYVIRYDTTPYIRESIQEVFKTLMDSVVLVALVVLLFLQNWRSALIPLVAVPVGIVGTFAVMLALGFSLNNLTLFGLVLAIGIVVDDAIVVVEAVEHHIEHGLSPRAATIQAMSEVSTPVIAVGLVLTAVFVPCAFISGITGQFFRQFALTIATSTLISAFNSLTLSPALAALLLKPRRKGTFEALPWWGFALVGAWAGATWLAPALADLVPHVSALRGSTILTHDRLATLLGAAAGAVGGWLLGFPINRVLGGVFALFNRGFDAAASSYTRLVGGLLRVSALVLLLYGGLLYVTYWGFSRTPTGFIPSQDKGYLLVNVQLPDSSSLERTQDVMKQAEELALKQPGVSHTLAIAGQSILINANAPNFGAMYVMLDDFHHRAHEGLTGPLIAARLQDSLQRQVHEGAVNVFDAPPVDGLGTAGGFKLIVEDRGDLGPRELEQTARRLVAAGDASPMLQGLFTSYRADTPWVFLDVDREKARLLGVPISELFNTLQVYLGSLYVNDFNRFGRTWQVNVQGRADFRQELRDLAGLRVRNDRGGMVPLGSLVRTRDVSGPVMNLRYNLYPSAAINLYPAPGVSSGQALDEMQRISEEELPQAMRSDWTELALLQRQTGNTAMFAFALAVVLVFLVLAAQYESWALPLAVILVVPMCLLCSTIGVNLWRMDVNIFTQVGFIVLVGLACKNAILIVEFAKARSEAGASAYEATLEACELRLRPIIMTSMAFILGVVPLILSAGAGAEMRQTLGVAVFSGMLGVTLFGIFLTPVFYYVIQRLADRRQAGRPTPDPDASDPHPHVRHGSIRDDHPHADLEPEAGLVSAP